MPFLAGTRMFRAIRGGDAAALRKLLEQGASPNIRDREGDTPLYKAALNDSPALVRLLLDAGADDGDRVLEAASLWGRHEVVRALLDAGARTSPSAFTEAAEWGHTETVRLLIGAGARDPDGSAIKAAASRDRFDIVSLLVDSLEYDSWTLACARDRDPAGWPYGRIALLLHQIVADRTLVEKSDVARSLRKDGPADEVSQTVFRWLERRQGEAIHVKCECLADGARSSDEGAWRVRAPLVAEENGTLTLAWRFDTLAWPPALKLPAATYHEVVEDEDRLEYRRGFGLSFEGFEANVQEKHEVDRWYTYTFSA